MSPLSQSSSTGGSDLAIFPDYASARTLRLGGKEKHIESGPYGVPYDVYPSYTAPYNALVTCVGAITGGAGSSETAMLYVNGYSIKQYGFERNKTHTWNFGGNGGNGGPPSYHTIIDSLTAPIIVKKGDELTGNGEFMIIPLIS